jgi:hypothetical protein
VWEFKLAVEEHSFVLGQCLVDNNFEVRTLVSGVHQQNIARPCQNRVPVSDQPTAVPRPKTIPHLTRIRSILQQPMIYSF